MDDRPPGWYRDPDNARHHRYWDGEAWVVAQVEREGLEVLEVLEEA